MALLIKPRPKQSRSSISRFQPRCRELIRRSLILATHTVTPANGKPKQKTYQNVSSRTSRSSKETRPERHWLPQVRNYNSRIRTAKKHFARSAFFIALLSPITISSLTSVFQLSRINKQNPATQRPGSRIDILMLWIFTPYSLS